MIVGAALIEIHVHGSRSLKEKRGVVRSIQQRVRNRFNLSVAEVGGQDLWQRAQIGLGAVGIEASRVRSRLERAVTFIEELHLAEVLASDIEIADMPHLEPDAAGPWHDDELEDPLEDEAEDEKETEA